VWLAGDSPAFFPEGESLGLGAVLFVSHRSYPGNIHGILITKLARPAVFKDGMIK